MTKGSASMSINNRYKQNYHANVLAGWSNDPNGMIYYNNKIRVYYQHYPYEPKWGIMHWGHFETDDFIKWSYKPLALTPNRPYEEILGCWSGNGIEKDGKLYMFYTGATPQRQTQCLAVSEDGVHFIKDESNPIIVAEDLNAGISPTDFRDPKVIKHDDMYYMFLGIKKDGFGNIALLSSSDLRNWSYVGHLFEPQDNVPEEFFRLQGVYECPDYMEIDGHQIIFTSPQHLPTLGNEYENVNSCIYIEGKLDFNTGHFTINRIHELDGGTDFYAAQAVSLPDGRLVMMAWKEMWHRFYPTVQDGWIGTYTIPRELSYENDRLIQRPVRELENYRTNEVKMNTTHMRDAAFTVKGVEGTSVDLTVEFDVEEAHRIGVKVFKGPHHETAIYYDSVEDIVVLDRVNSGIPISGEDDDVNVRRTDVGHKDHIKMRILLDVSSVEVFIDDGEYVLTDNVYPDLEDTGIEIFCEGAGTLVSLMKYDIQVD